MRAVYFLAILALVGEQRRLFLLPHRGDVARHVSAERRKDRRVGW